MDRRPSTYVLRCRLRVIFDLSFRERAYRRLQLAREKPGRSPRQSQNKLHTYLPRVSKTVVHTRNYPSRKRTLRDIEANAKLAPRGPDSSGRARESLTPGKNRVRGIIFTVVFRPKNFSR